MTERNGMTMSNLTAGALRVAAVIALVWTGGGRAVAGDAPSSPARQAARRILDDTGVRGGLVVHLGCGDGSVTAALRASEAYTVHGLARTPATVAKARATIRSKGLYGPVSVAAFSGRRLPYVDNLVNLVVADDLDGVPMAEVLRVLAPGGVAYVGSRKTVKPRPDAMDDWTHFLHGPDNNAVADDRLVGPPRCMQWLAGPTWTRLHHQDKGTQPAMRAMVSAGGRLFYLVDEATAANIRVPNRWVLVARDAFSGVRLWRMPVPAGAFPRRLEQLWRGLVADADHVYAALGPGEPITVLDAATGKVRGTYPETKGLEEVILAGGTLTAVVRDAGLVAVRAATGDVLWRWQPPKGDPIVPLTLAACAGNVFIRTDAAVRCLAADSGKPRWRFAVGGAGKRLRLAWPRAKLIAAGDVVLCSYGGKDPKVLNRDKFQYLGSHPRVNDYGGTLGALSVDDGRLLWKTVYRPGLESYPGDIFVVGGVVWLGPDFAEPRDLRSGKVLRTRPVLDRLWTLGHHHRCYPAKATSRYVLTGKRGVEMIDLEGEAHSRNNWVRGTCRLGVVPCNGLLYATPHSCGCYMEAKLYGFWALAGARGAGPGAAPDVPEGERLHKGPAYSEIEDQKPKIENVADWPTYRHDGARSGSTPAPAPAALDAVWRAELGGRITPPVVMAGRVVVAQTDAHRIVCLDAATGKEAWAFTAGGRVDSPPTIDRGRVLAGCADGYVYCLRLADGQLVWRFLAAPRRVHAVSYDQVESVWPVHGSVLVTGGVAYVVAGRSSHLDGGLVLYALDPGTGQVRASARVRSEHPQTLPEPTAEQREAMLATISQNNTDYKTFLAPDHSDAFSMDGARPDVLVAAGDSVYLRQLRFNGELARQKESYPHLFSTSSFLDGGEIHRSHWVLGTGDFTRTPVAYSWIAFGPTKWRDNRLSVPYGLILAFDERTVWGVRRNHLMRSKGGSKSPYVLFAQARPGASGPKRSLPDFRKEGVELAWTAPLALRPRAMVRAGEHLLLAGMSDTFDAKQPSAPCNAVFQGEGAGVLHVFATGEGKPLGTWPLRAPPVWDGIAVAGGRLYLSNERGAVVCLGRP